MYFLTDAFVIMSFANNDAVVKVFGLANLADNNAVAIGPADVRQKHIRLLMMQTTSNALLFLP